MKALIFALLGFMLVTVASAQTTLYFTGRNQIVGGINPGSGGGGSCSNSLDFSQSCNSQYVAIIF